MKEVPPRGSSRGNTKEREYRRHGDGHPMAVVFFPGPDDFQATLDLLKRKKSDREGDVLPGDLKVVYTPPGEEKFDLELQKLLQG